MTQKKVGAYARVACDLGMMRGTLAAAVKQCDKIDDQKLRKRLISIDARVYKIAKDVVELMNRERIRR